MEYTLQHHGVKGMKWGHRKADYRIGKSLVRQYNKLQKKAGDSKNYSEEYASKRLFKDLYTDAAKAQSIQSDIYRKQSKVISAQLRKMKISTLKKSYNRTTVTEFMSNGTWVYAKFRKTPINKLKIDKKAYKREKMRYKNRSN